MIERMVLESFKKFETLDLSFRKLNVLSGMNGSGKSTVIQALLLAHEAENSLDETVGLTAETGLNLGHAFDVLNQNSTDDCFTTTLIAAGGEEYKWTFDASSELDVPVLKIRAKPDLNIPLFGTSRRAFTYLSAERLGPRTTHPMSPTDPDDPSIGIDGRYAANALSASERNVVPPSLRHPSDTETAFLRAQTEAWLSEFVGKTMLEVTPLLNTNLLTLRMKKPGFSSEWVLPSNTGYGLSYCLPIVVAGLLARPGSTLIVDSPEAHLHPAGQSAMGRFLAQVANSGVQVFLETHSDHVINGIRRYISKSDGLLHEHSTFVFFNEESVDEISVTKRGKLSHWPSGFFDQIDNDLSELMGNIS